MSVVPEDTRDAGNEEDTNIPDDGRLEPPTNGVPEDVEVCPVSSAAVTTKVSVDVGELPQLHGYEVLNGTAWVSASGCTVGNGVGWPGSCMETLEAASPIPQIDGGNDAPNFTNNKDDFNYPVVLCANVRSLIP